jgi:hypothetical protein
MYILLAGAFMLGALVGMVVIGLLILAQASEETMELLGVDRRLPLSFYDCPDTLPGDLRVINGGRLKVPPVYTPETLAGANHR